MHPDPNAPDRDHIWNLIPERFKDPKGRKSDWSTNQLVIDVIFLDGWFMLAHAGVVSGGSIYDVFGSPRVDKMGRAERMLNEKWEEIRKMHEREQQSLVRKIKKWYLGFKFSFVDLAVNWWENEKNSEKQLVDGDSKVIRV